MADKTATIGPIEPNPLLDAASRGLSSLRSGLNYVPLPSWLGGGVGNALISGAPEEISNWAYGFHPFNDPKDWARTGPLREDRQSGVADVMMLPMSEMAGLAGLAAKGTGALARGAIEGGTSLGRRAFLKDAGTAAAGTAVAAPLLLKGLGKATEHAAPEAAARAISPHDYHAAVAKVGVQADETAHAAAHEAAHGAHPDHALSIWNNEYASTHHDVYQQGLSDLAEKHGHYPNEEEIRRNTQKFDRNGNRIHEDNDAYVKGLTDQGWLPSEGSWVAKDYPHLETVQDRVKSHGHYVDPFSGNRAVPDVHNEGDLVWTNGALDFDGSLATAQHQHWLLDDGHTVRAKQELGLEDKYGMRIGPKRSMHPTIRDRAAENWQKLQKERASMSEDPDAYGLDDTDIQQMMIDASDPSVTKHKRGGSIERTTRTRKIL
jgi:hypothetical protein